VQEAETSSDAIYLPDDTVHDAYNYQHKIIYGISDGI